MTGVPVVCNGCGEADTIEKASDAAPDGPWLCESCGWGSASPNTDLLGP